MVKSKGFTVIELMVVIAIIGILASMFFGQRGIDMEVDNMEEAGDNMEEAVIIINGIPHVCDEFGECKQRD